MNALRKSLMAVSAVLAVAPAAAFAYPPQCDEVCFDYCLDVCYEGTYRTSCEAAGWCSAFTHSEETASVSTEQSQQSEDTAPVCDAEQLQSVES
ncbi:hypothetical protein [Corallococcus sp. M7]